MASTININILGDAHIAIQALRDTAREAKRAQRDIERDNQMAQRRAATAAARAKRTAERDAERAERQAAKAAARAAREAAAAAAKARRNLRTALDGVSLDMGIVGQVFSIMVAKFALLGAAISLTVGPAFQLVGALTPMLGLFVALPAAITGAISLFGALKIATEGAGSAITAGLALTPAEVKKAAVAHRQALLSVSQAQSAYDKIMKKSMVDQVKVVKTATVGNIAHTKTVKTSTVSALDKANALERLNLAQAKVTDTTTAYSTALDALPPATRRFVQAVVAQRSAWDQLKANVSSAFFSPFVGQVRTLADRYLPILSKGLSFISNAVGSVVSKLIDAITKSKPLATGLKAIFGETAKGTRLAGSGITRFVDGFGRILTVGAPILRTTGSLIGKLSGLFGTWLKRMANSGQLKKWLDGGVKAAGQLWKISGNLLGIFSSIFRLGGEGSENLLDNITKLTGQFNAFLRTPRGAAEVRSFFQGLRDTTHVIWQTIRVLTPLVSAFGGVIARNVLPALKKMNDWFLKHKEAAKILGTVFAVTFAGSKLIGFLSSLAKIAKALKGIIVLEATADVAAALNPVGLTILAGAAILALGAYLGYLERKNHFIEHWWDSWSKFVVGIPGKIKAAFARLGAQMRDIGTLIVSSLLYGARSRWNAVKKFFSDLTTKITQWKGPPARDAVLLHGAGQSIMGGLIKGMTSQVPKLRTTLAGVSSTIASGIAGPSVNIQPVRPPDSHVHIHLSPGVKTIDAERELHQMLLSFQRRTGIKLLVGP